MKNPDDLVNENTRNQYGYLGGVTGIVANLLLFLIKLFIGLASSSISILADAFNNFFDSTSSIITMVGFKLASKPADDEHPFGHGRIEYLSALVVAFMVMMFGMEFLKASISKVFNPSPITFGTASFIILIISIVIKIWLSNFNYLIGNKINSSALKASALDAKGDVFTSSCVAISFLSSTFTNIPIDAYAGIAVSLGILYSGFNLIKETISPLLGEAPPRELVEAILNELLEHEHIIGAHDLIIHNYGANKCLASVHVEIPANLGVVLIHEVADDVERSISKKLHIHLVVHTDPVCVDDETIITTKKELESIIFKNSKIESMHDFRVVGENSKKNLIFDIVVSPSDIKNQSEENELIAWINGEVKNIHPNYNCIITIDKNFN